MLGLKSSQEKKVKQVKVAMVFLEFVFKNFYISLDQICFGRFFRLLKPIPLYDFVRAHFPSNVRPTFIDQGTCQVEVLDHNPAATKKEELGKGNGGEDMGENDEISRPNVKTVEKFKCVAMVDNNFMVAYGNDKKEAKQVASQSLLIYLTLLENDQVLATKDFAAYMKSHNSRQEKEEN